MQFKPDHVGLVQDKVSSIVTRGAFPMSESSDGVYKFAYTDLMAKINQLVGRKITNPILIDVCLLDCTGERDLFVPEVESFGVDPNRWPSSYWPPYNQNNWNPRESHGTKVNKKEGRFVWWPIQGMSEGDSPDVFLNSPGWDFAGCVDFIKKLTTFQFKDNVTPVT
jgi:hypothetical protein